MADKKSNIAKYQKQIDNNKYLQYLIYVTYKEEAGKTSTGMPNLGSFNESNDPKIGGNSSAFGMGQFTADTRNDILKKYGIDAWSEDRKEQEAAVIALTEHRGYLAQVSNGRFESLAENGPWEAFKSPDSEILNFFEQGDWNMELEDMRNGARFAPQESIANINPEIWALKENIYKSKGVNPLDNASEGSDASIESKRIIKEQMEELEKTLPKGVDNAGERIQTRATALEALNKEHGLGVYKTPDFKGLTWKKEAYGETNAKIFKHLGLSYDEDKTFLQNAEDNADKEGIDRAIQFEGKFREKLLSDMSFNEYEDIYAEEDYNIFTNIIYPDKTVGHVLRDQEAADYKATGKASLDKIQAVLDNADKYNLSASDRRALVAQKEAVLKSLKQTKRFELISPNQKRTEQLNQFVGIHGITEQEKKPMQFHLDIFKEADKFTDNISTPERIQADAQEEMVNLEEEKEEEKEKPKAPAYDPTEGGKYVDVPNVAGAEHTDETTTEGLLNEEQEVTLSESNQLAPPTPKTRVGKVLATLQIGGQKASDFLQDKGINSDSVNNALRAGAGLLSLYDATREDKVNKAKVSPLMLEAVRKADEISENGMPYEQQMAAIKDMNNAYAGAMKNVMAISGGQRGAALANMGGVDAARVNGLVDLAAKSSDMRMEGMKMYQTAVGEYTKTKLTADMSNEALQKKLDMSRKDRLAKVGSTLYEQAMEFNRNFKDEDTNTALLDAIAGIDDVTKSAEANKLALENLTKISESGFDQIQTGK